MIGLYDCGTLWEEFLVLRPLNYLVNIEIVRSIMILSLKFLCVGTLILLQWYIIRLCEAFPLYSITCESEPLKALIDVYCWTYRKSYMTYSWTQIYRIFNNVILYIVTLIECFCWNFRTCWAIYAHHCYVSFYRQDKEGWRVK